MFSIKNVVLQTVPSSYLLVYPERYLMLLYMHLPVPMKDGEIYKSFSDFFDTTATEKDRLTLQPSMEKSDSGVPFNPSGQFCMKHWQACRMYRMQQAKSVVFIS